MSEIMAELAGKVAAELGGTWRVWKHADPYFSGAELVDDRGWRLIMRPVLHKPGKVSITGILPGPTDCTLPARPSVTVTGTRPAAQIAVEVIRRVLPEYGRLLGKVLAYNAAQEAEQAAEYQLACQLAGLRPGPDAWIRRGRHSSGSVREDSAVLWNGGVAGSSGEVEVRRGGESVDLRLRDLPASLALEIMQLLATAKDEEAGR